MLPGTASNAAHSISVSVGITAGRLVHARVQYILQDHVVTTLTLTTAYMVLSLMMHTSMSKFVVLKVGTDTAAVAMTRALMLFTLSLQNNTSHELSLVVIGLCLVAASGVLQRLVPVVSSVFFGVQYAFVDLIHQISVFQNPDTKLLLGLVLLVAGVRPTGAHHATGIWSVFQSTLTLMGINYFVVDVVIPTEAGIPLDDVVLSVTAVLAAYALSSILPEEASGIVHSYVVSNLAQRVSNILTLVYNIEWWVVIVYDAVVLACVQQFAASWPKDAIRLLKNVLSMVAVTQVISTSLPGKGHSAVTFQFYDELFVILCGIVVVHFVVQALPAALS